MRINHIMNIQRITSDSLSFYRTKHLFLHFAEFISLAEYSEIQRYAKDNNLKLYILGNGSNTLFVRRRINSVIAKNCLPREITPMAGNRLRVTSSVPVAQVLGYCLKRSLDSFYFLAWVPANIGGALAMNAGTGSEQSRAIFDYVESVTFIENGQECTWSRLEIPVMHRWTPFTGVTERLIISAIFNFQPMVMKDNPLQRNLEFARTHLDNTGPNCGSVFKEAYGPIIRRFMGARLGSAHFSAKTVNWLLNEGQHVWPLLGLIGLVKLCHRVLGKQALLELVEVD